MAHSPGGPPWHYQRIGGVAHTQGRCAHCKFGSDVVGPLQPVQEFYVVYHGCVTGQKTRRFWLCERCLTRVSERPLLVALEIDGEPAPVLSRRLCARQRDRVAPAA